jgi:stage II sporulation protein M
MKEFLQHYYGENKPWILAVVRLFVLAAFVGALTFLIKPGLLALIVGIFAKKFGAVPHTGWPLAREIFVSNSTACLLALAGGILFGISPLLIVFFNGFIIGFIVLSLLALSGSLGQNLLYLVLGLLPHGIFEIPAFILAASLGLRLGIEWMLGTSRGRRGEVIKNNLRRCLVAVPILAAALFIAAIVEVFVSGQLVSNFK